MNIFYLFHDGIVFVLLQTALGALLLAAISPGLRAKWRARTTAGHAIPTVYRGNHSMNFLYIVYGVATVVFALSIQVSEALVGYKVLLLVFDYLVLTYLFFFNGWFRNRLFTIQVRIEKD